MEWTIDQVAICDVQFLALHMYNHSISEINREVFNFADTRSFLPFQAVIILLPYHI